MDSTPASLSPSCHPPPQDCLYSSCLFSCWQTWGFHLRHLTSPPGSAPFPEFSPSERNEKTISRDPQDACCDSSLRPSLWQGTRSELSGERMLGLSKECWPIREAEKQVLRGVHLGLVKLAAGAVGAVTVLTAARAGPALWAGLLRWAKVGTPRGVRALVQSCVAYAGDAGIPHREISSP